jgi:hypothetical protein
MLTGEFGVPWTWWCPKNLSEGGEQLTYSVDMKFMRVILITNGECVTKLIRICRTVPVNA